MRWMLVAAALALVTGCSTSPPPVAGPAPDPAAVGMTRTPAPVPSAGVLPKPAPPGPVHPRQAGPAARMVEHLVVASRRIDAIVRPVHFRGRELAIPPAVDEVGFWVDGAGLNDAVGTTVLVGHVSDDHDRPGTMARLAGVRVGAVVAVAPARGAVHRFRVVAVRSYGKDRLPRGVFAQSGPHRLVLITCSHRVDLPGGGFHYSQNLVVTARPMR